jgi:UDP-N-acetylmuramoyl-tripeptide--D-alanyl-D-alanine ligase
MSTEELYQAFLEGGNICTDSRKLTPGAIFFGLPGESFDGGSFGEEAIRKGCRFSIVSPKWESANPAIICSPDPLKTLQDLALYHRRQFQIPLVAITGTNGKTTTKELVSAILSTRLKTHSTMGNLNNHIGVPLTLLSMPADTEIAIIEMGANHPGEIDFLCQLAEPNFGMITSLGKAHLEGFGSFEGVVKTKTELYRWLLNHQGQIFLHSEHEILSRHADALPRWTYGTLENDDISGTLLNSSPLLTLEWKGRSGLQQKINSQLFGSYNLINVLAALCVGEFFGIDPNAASKAIELYQPQNNRSQVFSTFRNTLILDAYNANPSSMELAITSFQTFESSKKAVILGDMLELGDFSPMEHHGIIQLLKKQSGLRVFLVGSQFAHQADGSSFSFYHSVDELIQETELSKLQEYTILVKGSRGIALERVIPYL